MKEINPPKQKSISIFLLKGLWIEPSEHGDRSHVIENLGQFLCNETNKTSLSMLNRVSRGCFTDRLPTVPLRAFLFHFRTRATPSEKEDKN